jgi:hypothetical protein
MRKVLLVVGLLAMPLALCLVPRAHAAEVYRGTIFIQDAGCVHNLFPTDAGAFYIAPNSLITVQPDQNAFICVDELSSTKAPTCSTTNVTGTARGVYVLANTAFPSSCKPAQPALMADGGMVVGCVVSVCASGVVTVNAPVWSRKGDEW